MNLNLSIKKIVQWVVIAIVAVLLAYGSWVMYINRAQERMVSVCDGRNLTFAACQDYSAELYYDSMDGMYIIDKIHSEAEQIDFNGDECRLDREGKGICTHENRELILNLQ